MISQANSMFGWDFFQFLKGRKRSLVTVIAAGLTMFMSDNAFAALLAGIVIEAGFSIGEFFFTRVEI